MKIITYKLLLILYWLFLISVERRKKEESTIHTYAIDHRKEEKERYKIKNMQHHIRGLKKGGQSYIL